MRYALVPLFALAMLVPGTPALATLAATYAATPPAQAGAGTSFAVAVTVTNTGDETWKASGPNPVNLSYHWYDSSGNLLVVWDGVRTPLGTDVAPTATRTLNATVQAPSATGAYVLRFALVREGVAWFTPSGPYSISVSRAYDARFDPVTLPATFLTGASYQVSVPVTNQGTATWNAAPPPPLVDLSYHWHDGAGNLLVWDGVRTSLGSDMAAGASRTLTATIVAPNVPCTCTLTIDMVREGVSWFQFLGSTPLRMSARVASATYAATWSAATSGSAFLAETKSVPVTVTNSGNVSWNAAGANPINLSYHLLNSAGAVVLWDGARTSIGADMAPGASKAFTISYVSPRTAGTYTLVIDMVREGVGWFQFMGSPPHRQTLTVTTGLNAGYGASTTPTQATIGATLPLTVEVFNFGARTWTPGAFALSYHIFTSSGGLFVWDGNRGQLPANMAPGTSAVISINVTLPGTTGNYVVAWDMVQEGVVWFSGVGVPRKEEPISVVPGVTFYGSGFGHGVGMSQYGAQGWATGATGAAPLTAEQIIAKYYTGVAISPSDPARAFNRVLLSAPSSQGRFLCGDNKYFDGTLADLHSSGGMRVVDESRANLEIDRGPGDYQLVARNGKLEVWRNWPPASQVYVGDGPITVVPLDPAQPMTFIQKGGAYRGNIRFTNLGGTLRVINALSYDDYTRGVLPLEMPTTWHPEALKAQAYAARTYAYTGYQGGSRDYDMSDDQSDQCYGGVRVEKDPSNAAVAATAGKIITYNGASIRSYFSSSDGGYTLSDGCWMAALKLVNGVWTCSPGQPYLQPVADPADRAVTTPVANPRASWQATFTSDQIRDAVIRCGGPNIGTLQSVDVSSRAPSGVGHVISVRVVGTAASANLRADDFLRTCLGLRSTMVRLSPF